jgi:hypothetical protein
MAIINKVLEIPHTDLETYSERAYEGEKESRAVLVHFDGHDMPDADAVVAALREADYLMPTESVRDFHHASKAAGIKLPTLLPRAAIVDFDPLAAAEYKAPAACPEPATR